MEKHEVRAFVRKFGLNVEWLDFGIGYRDSNGLALAKMEVTDVLYKLIMERDGILIDQTDKAPFIAQDYYFRINLLPDFLDSWNKVGELNSYLIGNNDTGTFTFWWNDGSDIVQTGCMEVIRRSAYRDQQLYYECRNSTFSSLSYTINKSIEGNYIATGTIDTNTNNTLYGSQTAELIIENVTLAIFGVFGTFLTLFLFVVLSCIGFSHNPATSIVLGIMGISIATILNLMHLTWVSIMLLIFFGILLIYFIRT